MIFSWVKKKNITTLFFMATTILLVILLVVSLVKSDKTSRYDSTSVLNRIVYIQDLALVKYNYTGVIGFKDNMKILNINVPLTDKFFLLKYNGFIKAGVDFSQIKVDVNEKNVHVSIPKSKIMDTVIDENSVQVYNESDNAFNPIKIADYNKAILQEKNTMTRDALNQGILKEANEQADFVLRSLLKEMGFEHIEITEEITLPQYH